MPENPVVGQNRWLCEALNLAPGDTPFPWQEELLRRFMLGAIDRSLDIPTGLGKTAVMAIWLVARACGAPLPRRLAYVVDRRAVVDQATDVAKGLRDFVDQHAEFKASLGLGVRSLSISTLRGQYVDNREWLEDPAAPAIIVGTVDMVGSRLLFEGYGTSRKMRPYHAGLLGADTLVTLDEAHLVSPFEKLLEAIADGGATLGSRDEALRQLVPPFRLLSLSATGRASTVNSIGLQDADLKHDVVRKRLDAPKRLTMLPLTGEMTLTDELAKHAWAVAGEGAKPVRCIVFCDKRKDAEETLAAIEMLAQGDKKTGKPATGIDLELFVGGRRVFEREGVADWLKTHGFIAGTKVQLTRPAFVIATSAGEVGVDLDAEHMVSDLVAWERMVQRLGRVNRRGDGTARVVVVVEPPKGPTKAIEGALKKDANDRTDKDSKAISAYEASVGWVRNLPKPFERLPEDGATADVSPGALRNLKLKAAEDPELQAIIDAATTRAPLRPALSRALIDAWSMTSLEEHTGRPEIEPWLRGWEIDEPPQTAVAWRRYLPTLTRSGETLEVSKKEVEDFFEAAPPHVSELLEIETYRVVGWLVARAKDLASPKRLRSMAPNDGDIGEAHRVVAPMRMEDIAAIVLQPTGDFRCRLALGDLVPADGGKDLSKAKKEELEHCLVGATLVVDARIGGLTNGLLDEDATEVAHCSDDGEPWLQVVERGSNAAMPVVRFRVRTSDTQGLVAGDASWRERRRFVAAQSDDGEALRWLVIDKWRHDSSTEEDRSSGRPQLLDAHQVWAAERVRDCAKRLGLPEAYIDMLEAVALVHDEGKRASRWQRAFNAPADGFPYAKTRGPISYAILDGYRHEFGSLLLADEDPRLSQLTEDLRDLALHLIAAHHGFARPIIRTVGCESLPPSALEERAGQVALRFARLQKRWGPWGLAWWESLLRAADQQASRDNDVKESPPVKESA